MKEDLIQYITNALYRAHDYDMQTMKPIEFDKWVEEQTLMLGLYFDSQSQEKKVSNADIVEAAYRAFPYDSEGIPDSHSYAFCQGAEYMQNKSTASLTDDDINAWADENSCIRHGFSKGAGIYDGNRKNDLIEGAKAMRDGLITHK